MLAKTRRWLGHVRLIIKDKVIYSTTLVFHFYYSDGLSEDVGRDIFTGPPHKKVRDHIEKLGKSSWIGVACGFWYEYSLGGGPCRYGFDFKNRTVTFFDDGTTRLNTSTWP
jgi:hypothetical protein